MKNPRRKSLGPQGMYFPNPSSQQCADTLYSLSLTNILWISLARLFLGWILERKLVATMCLLPHRRPTVLCNSCPPLLFQLPAYLATQHETRWHRKTVKTYHNFRLVPELRGMVSKKITSMTGFGSTWMNNMSLNHWLVTRPAKNIGLIFHVIWCLLIT